MNFRTKSKFHQCFMSIYMLHEVLNFTVKIWEKLSCLLMIDFIKVLFKLCMPFGVHNTDLFPLILANI